MVSVISYTDFGWWICHNIFKKASVAYCRLFLVISRFSQKFLRNKGKTALTIFRANTSAMNDNRRLAGIVFTFSRKQNGEFWPVYEGSNKIGRLTDNAICLSHGSVSPAHASIFAIESIENQLLDFRIMDIGSETGTIVDGAQLFAGDKASLSLKSICKIGLFELIFIPIDGVKEAYATHPALLESVDSPTPNNSNDSLDASNSIANLLKTISAAKDPIDPRGTTI